MYVCARFLGQAARARLLFGARRPLCTTTIRCDKSADKFFVTQPIFYVNSVPHIGHFYTIVLADAIQRYASMQGKVTKLSAGTDEHGLKIQQAAARAGQDPLSFCTQYSGRFRELMTAANVGNTDFIRTTDEQHRHAVTHFWNRLVDRGYIYKGEHAGWYAVSDEAFYTGLQVEERIDPSNGKRGMFAIESGQPVEWVSEVNYRFKLSAFKDRLIEWIEGGQDVIYPEIRRNEVLAWLRSDMDDLSVSRPRSRLKWGIPVPGDDEHTIYVWVDALVNYATVDGYPWTGAKPSFFPPDVQVVGKDIVRFHAVYWPALLMAADMPLPKRILAHAHWTMGLQKMSKSKGNVADPFEAIERFGLDSIRYFMIRNGGISDDGDYSPEEVLVRHKKDLAGQLANLASRCLSERLAVNLDAFAGLGKKLQCQVDSRDAALHSMLVELPDKAKVMFDKGEFGRGLGLAFDALAEANRHISENEPWSLAKSADPEHQARLQVVLFYSLEAVRLASILLLPTMPDKASRLLDHIAIAVSERQWAHAQFGAGWQSPGPKRPLPGVASLFPKLPLPS
ncbi:methionyl-tRNA synthetase [Coemansia thaxteri]|nr:methionyl-tRNA synthetase [Coemansia thaxteri]KAJ2467025.1 methionyl-tRNA synthetase [Coemansia sp. RSA 2322]